jgi:hypothetical protein
MITSRRKMNNARTKKTKHEDEHRKERRPHCEEKVD